MRQYNHHHHIGQAAKRPDPEQIKREGWMQEGVLVVKQDDQRLNWPERELVKQLGEKLYGKRKEENDETDKMDA